MSMGQQIKKLRIERGLGQRALGEIAGLTRDQVASIEIGRRAVSSTEVALLSEALDIDIDELLRPEAVRRYRMPELDHASKEIINMVSDYARASRNLRDLEWLYASEL